MAQAFFEERLEAGRKDRVAGVDGVLGVADQMGEAELMRGCMLALGREAVGDPHVGPGAAEERDGHRLAARRRDGVGLNRYTFAMACGSRTVPRTRGAEPRPVVAA